MILTEGNKLFVVHRRLFEDDEARFFIGVVDGYEAGIAKVTGFSWIREKFGGIYVRKDGWRTKIFSLISGTLLVYQLPDFADPEKMVLEASKDGKLWLTDHDKIKMDMSEKEYLRGGERIA